MLAALNRRDHSTSTAYSEFRNTCISALHIFQRCRPTHALFALMAHTTSEDDIFQQLLDQIFSHCTPGGDSVARPLNTPRQWHETLLRTQTDAFPVDRCGLASAFSKARKKTAACGGLLKRHEAINIAICQLTSECTPVVPASNANISPEQDKRLQKSELCYVECILGDDK